MDNSRFKFRAWFPAWEEVFILSEVNGALLNGDMELMTLELFDELVNGEHEQYEKWIEQPDAILMQFTGLTDKNGVDIYEGDILQTYYGKEVDGRPFVATYVKGAFVQVYPNGTTRNISSIEYTPEVIGNIHENKELLA